MRKIHAVGMVCLLMCMLAVPKLASALDTLPPSVLPDIEIGAAGAVLLDMETGRVLAAKNAHARLPMASTTKVMTALLAIEHCSLDEMITIPKEAYAMEGSSMYLNLGEKITMEDLLYGLMLSSGNDAAVAIAIHIGGSVEGFAQLMNTRAAKIGCVNTNFVTPNGLHDAQHYTSAYDLALICANAMQNEVFQTIVGTQYHTCKSGDVQRTLKNKNKLLWNYEGGSGIKTGYTKDAGKCLAFSAKRNGHTIVGIVLNAPSMWEAATTMMDHGFRNYTWESIMAAGEVVLEIDVRQGMKNSLEILAKEDILIPLREGEDAGSISLRANCTRILQAPIFAGQQVGELQAWADGRLLKSVALVAAETVMKKEYTYYVGRLIRDFIA